VVANIDVVAHQVTVYRVFNFPKSTGSKEPVVVEIFDPINHNCFISGSHDHLTLPIQVVARGKIESICLSSILSPVHLNISYELECLPIEKGDLGDSAASA